MIKNILIGMMGFALCLLVMFIMALIPRWKALTMCWAEYQTHEKVMINRSFSLK